MGAAPSRKGRPGRRLLQQPPLSADRGSLSPPHRRVYKERSGPRSASSPAATRPSDASCRSLPAREDGSVWGSGLGGHSRCQLWKVSVMSHLKARVRSADAEPNGAPRARPGRAPAGPALAETSAITSALSARKAPGADAVECVGFVRQARPCERPPSAPALCPLLRLPAGACSHFQVFI